MKSKRIVPRSQANRDIDEIVNHYVDTQVGTAAAGFIDELERAYAEIGRYPAMGSPRYAHDLDIPGLRSRRLKRYPYIVFHVENSAQVDIWRILHSSRDIPTSMREPESGEQEP